MALYMIFSVIEHLVLESGGINDLGNIGSPPDRSSMFQWLKQITLRILQTRRSTYASARNGDESDLESPSPRTPGSAGESPLGIPSSFDFTKNSTKLVYAGAKLCVALSLAIFYIIFFKVMFTLPYIKTSQKSVFLLSTLVLLSIFRDKHEKKIASSYDPSALHMGRALLTPLVYVSFTVLSLIDQSLISFFTATMY